jgi:hypothetical protein
MDPRAKAPRGGRLDRSAQSAAPPKSSGGICSKPFWSSGFCSSGFCFSSLQFSILQFSILQFSIQQFSIQQFSMSATVEFAITG